MCADKTDVVRMSYDDLIVILADSIEGLDDAGLCDLAQILMQGTWEYDTVNEEFIMSPEEDA